MIPGAVRALSYVPFGLRKGPKFKQFTREIVWFEEQSLEAKKQWIFERVSHIVTHAEKQIPFYREFYGDAGFSSNQLKGYGDLTKIPIVTKADLKAWPLEDRCSDEIPAVNSNTGGTTGQPLSFKVEEPLGDKEWAYIYHMWQRRDWRPGFLKLRFGGANLGSQVYQYVPTEGEFLINTYLGQDEVCRAIADLLKRYPIHYLHGYPSALASFARHAVEHYKNEIVTPIKKHLRGILLGSEYPAPMYRRVIEETFGRKTFSWYGHSEKAILAGEKDEPFLYYPFQSYGWTEAVPQADGASSRLIGTNFHGFASPFIRYDTGDLIDPVEITDGLLGSFRVAEGRVGDVVLDVNGSEISLTALIFGRHHGVFSEVKHLQVTQDEPGRVTLLATGFPELEDRERAFWAGFDTTGVALDFEVKFLDAPVRTASGKIALMVANAKQ